MNTLELNNTVENLPNKLFLGVNETERIYLSRPSFDCGWYWGFGYLGNKNCHYHLDGIGKYENINFFDAIKKHFGDSFIIKDEKHLWTFCEVVRTIYTLKKAAETFHRGGSHYTTNPDAEIIKSKEFCDHINNVLLPAQFQSLYKSLGAI